MECEEKQSLVKELQASTSLTPEQSNEIILCMLDLLQPELESALKTFKRVEDALANGKINWRKIFERAKTKEAIGTP